jgi:hypothetical protein
MSRGVTCPAMCPCDPDGDGQVVVLGAGFDTTWFQLTSEAGAGPGGDADACPYTCLEVDFKEASRAGRGGREG